MLSISAHLLLPQEQSMNCVLFFCRLCGLAGAMPLRTRSCQNFSTKMGLLSWVRICASELMSRPCFKMSRLSETENLTALRYGLQVQD